MHAHHPHSSHEGRTSTWKTHFKEFTMLFMAVLCGYISEVIFENHLERRRERIYLRSLAEDLEKDTVMLTATIRRAMEMSDGLDSLQECLFHFNQTNCSDELMYQLNFNNTRWILPEFNDKTITQLRYSGNFRLIENNELANNISDYWIEAERIKKNAEEYILKVERAEGAMSSIFNRKFVRTDTASHFRHNKFIIDPQARLLTRDTLLLTSYANLLHVMTDISGYYMIPFMRHQKVRARELITEIREEID